jgi:apolipoprotein N-acyltransferase
LFFAPLALTNKPYIRAILLFGLSFVEPFDWNWMKIELLFVDSYFGIYKYQLAIILTALALPSLVKEQKYKLVPLALLLFALQWHYKQPPLAPLKIKLVQTDVPQEKKWLYSELYPTIAMIFQEIQKARDEKYDVIVLPESVFPLFMNKNPKLQKQLEELSHNIAIVTGTLYRKDGLNYNVTYTFDDGKVQIAKKLVLVPFGEYIPLPKFAQKFINDTFFSGASDFVTAKHPTDIFLKGVKFRNAICYEATCDEVYAGDVKYVIAVSNNAWFIPSIEPTLQRILMKFYARKYGVIIYHSANAAGTGVVF